MHMQFMSFAVHATIITSWVLDNLCIKHQSDCFPPKKHLVHVCQTDCLKDRISKENQTKLSVSNLHWADLKLFVFCLLSETSEGPQKQSSKFTKFIKMVHVLRKNFSNKCIKVIGVMKFHVVICPTRGRCFENFLGCKEPTYQVHCPSIKTNLYYFNAHGPLLTAKGEVENTAFILNLKKKNNWPILDHL